MKGFQVVGRRLVEQCFVDGETETLWKMMVMMISMMVVMVMMVMTVKVGSTKAPSALLTVRLKHFGRQSIVVQPLNHRQITLLCLWSVEKYKTKSNKAAAAFPVKLQKPCQCSPHTLI